MISEHAREVFGSQNVFNERELESRYEVMLEDYINRVGIDADLLQELSNTYILPAACSHLDQLGDTYRKLCDMGLKDNTSGMIAQAEALTESTERLAADLARLAENRSFADSIDNMGERAVAYADQVKPLFDDIRTSMNALEGLVDNKLWPLPKYRELLFLR